MIKMKFFAAAYLSLVDLQLTYGISENIIHNSAYLQKSDSQLIFIELELVLVWFVLKYRVVERRKNNKLTFILLFL